MEENQILIEADDNLLTAISFIILDNGTTLTMCNERLPSGPIGVLPLHSGIKLCVIARFQPEGNLRQNAITAIEDTNNINLSLEEHEGKILHVCITGDNRDGYPYMATFPVEVNRESAGSDCI